MPLWPTRSHSKSYSLTEEIQKRVTELAAEIRRDFPDDLHLVAVLKGAFIFLSDLVRHMTGARLARFHRRVELREGHDDLRRGPAAQGPRHRARGRDVVIVEDIVDTG